MNGHTYGQHQSAVYELFLKEHEVGGGAVSGGTERESRDVDKSKYIVYICEIFK